jgi:signal peptidase I
VPLKVRPSDCMAHTLLNNHIYKFFKQTDYSINDIIAYQSKDIITGKEFITVGRIMGIQGDEIEFKNGDPYRNKAIFPLPKTATMNYLCVSKDRNFIDSLKSKYKLDVDGDSIVLNLTNGEFENLKVFRSDSFIIKKFLFDATTPDFPNKFNRNWSRDFFGPLNIPRNLNSQDTSLLLVSGGYSADELIKDPVYFVVGDNVQNAFDSRYMGLVSKKLIVGKLSTIVH